MKSLSLAFLVFLCSTGLAQSLDQPKGVPVRVWMDGVCNTNLYPGQPSILVFGSSVMTTTDIPNGSLNQVTLGYSGSFSSVARTVSLEPGKSYAFSVIGNSVQEHTFSAKPPPGYRIEIDSIATTRVRRQGSGQRICMVRVTHATGDFHGRAGTATSLENGKYYWQVALGGLPNGDSARALTLVDEAAGDSWAQLFTPASLYYENPSSSVDVQYESGLIRQVHAPESSVDVCTLSSTSYELRFYHPSQVQGTSGLRTFTGLPFVTYRIAQGASATILVITSERRDLTATNQNPGIVRTAQTSLERIGSSPSFTWTMRDWHDSTSTASVVDVKQMGGTDTARTEIHQIKNDLNVTSFREEKAFTTFNWGEEIVSKTVGTSNPLTTNYAYYTEAPNDDLTKGRYGYVKSMSSSDGSWVAFEYHSSGTQGNQTGMISRRHRPYKNAPASVPSDLAQNSQGEITSYTYSADAFGMMTRPATIETRRDGVLCSRTTLSYNDTSYRANNKALVQTIRRDYSDAGYYLTTTSLHYLENIYDLFYRGKVHSTTSPDGVKQSYAYHQGTYSSGVFSPGTGAASRAVVITGTTTSSGNSLFGSLDSYDIDDLYLVSGKSTRQDTIYDNYGRVARVEQYAWNGSWNRVGYSDYEYDFCNRLVRTSASNGAQTETGYLGEQVAYKVDASGIRKTFSYDTAGRVQSVTQEASANIPALTTRFEYNANGQAVSEIIGYGLSENLVSSRSFDDSGRLTSTSQPGVGTSNIAYSPSSRQVTATLPTVATHIESRLPDGRISSVSGSSVVPEFYSYETDSSGREVFRVDIGAATSSRYSKTTKDWLGRITHTEAPGFSLSSKPAITSLSVYDAATGQLKRVQRSGGLADQLYQYDPMGSLVISGLDLDSNGALGESSTDRLSRTETGFEHDGTNWWAVSTTYAYFSSGSATRTPLEKHATQLTGLSGGQSVSKISNAEGYVTTTTTTVNRGTKTVATVVSSPGLNNRQSVVQNGLLISETTADGLAFSRTYDSLHRFNASVDPKTGSTVTSYHSGTGLISQVTDPTGTVVSTRAYDAAGRLTLETNAQGKTTRYEYNLLNQIVRQWGSAATPVSYVYDSYGQKTEMRMYRNTGYNWNASTWPGNATTDNVTAWVYDVASGKLYQKRDADNQNTQYDYDSAGRISTRMWSRTYSGSRVTTTYSYHLPTGDRLGTSYNDTTPAVSYAYSRAGQLETVSDYTGVRDFIYDTASNRPWRLSGEGLDTFYGQRLMARLYNESGLVGTERGFQLGFSGNLTAEGSQTYDIGQRGRVSSASYDGISTTYSYLSNAASVGSVATGGTYVVQNSYEPNRHLRTGVESRYNGSVKARHSYTYDTLGRRSTALQEGEAFGAATYQRYEYTDRSEVAAAKSYTGTNVNSTANPIAGRQHVQAYDGAGNRLWRTSTNGAPAEEQVVYNKLNNIQTSTLSGVSVSFSYDLDGNLTGDGRWQYAYDGENRLWRMETSPSARASGQAWWVLEFRYDYQGRRVQKSVYDGSTGNLVSARRYLYDGWNLVGEYDAQAGTCGTRLRSYQWGLDVTGAIHGSGGVGGLLQIVDHALSKRLYPCYDANGNVTALVNGATGSVEAKYEYGPFGQTVSITGTYTANPFRFSTKFTDEETGLLYYGHRFYSPTQGRFINRDPIEESGGIKLYGFCLNDPVNLWDVLGMDPPDAGIPLDGPARWAYEANKAAQWSRNPITRPYDFTSGLTAQADAAARAYFAVTSTSDTFFNSAGSTLPGNFDTVSIGNWVAQSPSIPGTEVIIGECQPYDEAANGPFGQSQTSSGAVAPNNASNPIDVREQTYGRGDAESTAAVKGLLDTLRGWNLPNGTPTEIAKRIAAIEASGSAAAIYGTNEKMGNAYAFPILRDGSPTGGYVLINPREVYQFGGPSKGIYSDPFGTLAHELTHLSDYISSGYSRSIQREFEAVRVENQLRALQGFPLREYYGKTPVPNYDQYVYRPNSPTDP